MFLQFQARTLVKTDETNLLFTGKTLLETGSLHSKEEDQCAMQHNHSLLSEIDKTPVTPRKDSVIGFLIIFSKNNPKEYPMMYDYFQGKDADLPES